MYKVYGVIYLRKWDLWKASQSCICFRSGRVHMRPSSFQFWCRFRVRASLFSSSTLKTFFLQCSKLSDKPAALESLTANWANHLRSVRGNSRLAVLEETLIQSQRGSYPVTLSTSHSFVCSCRASECEWTFKLFSSESASVQAPSKQEVQQESGGGNNMPM